MQDELQSGTQKGQKRASTVAPFGYRLEGGKLIVDEAEAHILKLAYELFLTHQRKKTVARLLNEKGFCTRSGAQFSDTTLDRLFRDVSAKGSYQPTEGKTSRTSKAISMEPIVSNEVWDQVNAILESGQRLGKKTTQLFAGFVHCQCGGKMNVPSNSPKYICSTCRRKISTQDLEEIFHSQLKAFLVSPEGEAPKGIVEIAPSLADYWFDLTKDEKRIIVEQIASRIVIGERDIHIEFGLAPNSFETMTVEQQTGTTSLEQVEPGQSLVPKEQITELREPLMNETQAAKFLGISRMTLLRKRNNGEIKFFRVGFRILYSKENHLAPFLATCEETLNKRNPNENR